MRICARSLAAATLVCALITVLAEAADLVKPDIKPGLWEVTTHPQISGQMPIPEDQLAKMTPEQRARMEAAMQSGMTNAVKPRVYKECMTAEKIAKGFDTGAHDDASCKKNVIASSRSELHLREDCSRPDGKTTVDVHFQISGGTQMTGTINAVMSSGSRTMTMNSKVQGKWLGASCGSVKDEELEK
ncbi:MAG TPA: DUF3617 domain-containing protein [Steroidobacteraceae bacterium]|jgi:hypothetical protein